MKKKANLTKHINTLLVFSLSLTLYLIFLLVIVRDVQVSDESLYHNVGLAYVNGIASGNIEAFLLNSEHPPLAKIITGLFVVFLEPFGLGEYPFPTRIQFSLTVALLAVYIFRIGEKIGDHTSGWLFWLFFLPVPAITSKNYYSIVDATSLLFLLLAFKSSLLEKRQKRGGIFYGLASLSKFIPLPLYPAVVMSWSLYKREKREEILSKFKWICAGLLIFWLGEPLLWNTRLFFLMIDSLYLHKHSLAIWSVPLLHYVEGETEAIFEIIAFLFYTISYPSERFLSLNPYVLLMASLYLLVLKNQKLTEIETLLLLWVSVTHLIFAVNRVRMWYHDFWMVLPMSLFLSTIVSRLVLGKVSPSPFEEIDES